jgi:hypothetical protein
VAVSDPERLTLVLRYADVGIATYASLRIVGQPSRTVAWVIEEPILLTAIEELANALPEPHGTESRRDAIERALTQGPWATTETELTLAYILGVLLIGSPGWQLLAECITARGAVRIPQRASGACSLGAAGGAEIGAKQGGIGTRPPGRYHRQRQAGRPDPLATD